VSSVALTPPSSEFSIGTSAASTSPAAAARIVSRSPGHGTASAARARGEASSAAWVNVPGCPK
jgi:hypothetical protein